MLVLRPLMQNGRVNIATTRRTVNGKWLICILHAMKTHIARITQPTRDAMRRRHEHHAVRTLCVLLPHMLRFVRRLAPTTNQEPRQTVRSEGVECTIKAISHHIVRNEISDMEPLHRIRIVQLFRCRHVYRSTPDKILVFPVIHIPTQNLDADIGISREICQRFREVAHHHILFFQQHPLVGRLLRPSQWVRGTSL